MLSSTAWTNASTGATENINPSTFMGFIGASFAFVLSTLGAIDNMKQTIYWVEDGLDDWLKGYSKKKYAEIIKDEKKSKEMQDFLNKFTLGLIDYTASSVIHSVFLVMAGFVGAFLIYQ